MPEKLGLGFPYPTQIKSITFSVNLACLGTLFKAPARIPKNLILSGPRGFRWYSLTSWSSQGDTLLKRVLVLLSICTEGNFLFPSCGFVIDSLEHPEALQNVI